MRPDPATADIYIDDEKVPTENGLFTATMKKGTHTYRVESPMYASEAGIIDLGSEQKIMSVTLKPRFGYLEIFSLPETMSLPDRHPTRVTECHYKSTGYASKKIFSSRWTVLSPFSLARRAALPLK